jgi:chromosome segregation ATPase
MVKGTMSLHAAAEQWASTETEIKRARDEQRRADERVRSLRHRQDTLETQLQSRVGPNDPLKIFQVAPGEVVIVEHQKSVRLVSVTPKDQG